MNNPPVKLENLGEVMQSVMIKSDLSKLTPYERLDYTNAVCKSLGLNPLTGPFDFIWINGKLVFYAKKDCTDQLRRIYSVSVQIVERKLTDEILVVHAKATLPDGRCDEDFGAVPFHAGLKGEIRSNAVMKAVTKAKRRVTLSICGLGFLDESEIDSIPTSALRVPPGEVEIPNGNKRQAIQPPRQDQSDFPGDRPPEEGLPEMGRKRKNEER